MELHDDKTGRPCDEEPQVNCVENPTKLRSWHFLSWNLHGEGSVRVL